MIGKLVKSLLLGLTLTIVSVSPVSVFALGVGGLNLASSLNKPLEAKIEILGVEGNELETLTVNLAAADVYDRMGIELTAVQDLLKFRVDQDEKGAPFIRVYTTDAVNEPFLNFLLEVNWSSGRLLREFTVLLDPPTFEEEQAKPVESPQMEPSPAVIEQEARDFEVAGPEVVVNAPPIEGEKTREVVDYGPIKTGENLWNISGRIKPSDISRQQIMLALFRQNPDAFFRNNPSMLKEGAVLRLDDIDAARRIPIDEAIAEMARHHQDWLAYRRERAASRAIAAESAGGELHGAKAPEAPDEAELEATKEPVEPMLKLVTPSSEEAASLGIDSATADRLETDLNTAKIELAMANELLEATRQENKDLNGRINALESQLQKMNSLIELRDKEMQLTQSEISSSEKITPAASLDTSPDDGNVIKEPETPEKAKSAVDIFKDPLTVGTIVGVIVLLLWFFIIVSRNKNKTKADFAAAAAEEEAIFADSKADAAPANIETDAADVNDLGFSSSEPVQNPEDFIDPISEADVYIAYGKYDKAEELLKPAIEQNPDRHEIKLKLLEVYSLSENKDEFEERVEELYASLSGDKENPLWLKAVELAESVCPNNPLLFSDTDSRDSVFLDESAASALDTLAVPERDESLLSGEDSTQIIEKDIIVEDEIETSAPEIAKIDEISSIEDKQYDTNVASEVGMLSLDEAELELTGIGEDTEPSEPTELAVEQAIESATDDTMIQSIENVDSIGMSDLELSQLEPGEDLSLSTGGRVSEPQVTEHGLTSMLQEFDEPDIGEIVSAQDDQARLDEDISAIAETEVVSVGYDSQFEVKNDEPLTSTMSDISSPQVEGDSVEEVSNIFSEDSVSQTPAADFDDTSMFLLADEVGTKLDLARAYIEMGDKEGAVELLREVEDEGNPKQQADAKGLLELAG